MPPVTRSILANLVVAVAFAMFPPLVTATTAAERILLKPGDDIQAIVDANPPGSLYMLQAGVYRTQQIVPKDGDVFDGGGKAVLNGSRLLTAFARSGRAWVAAHRTQQGRINGARECQPTFPRCHRSEDLYIDDVPMGHVERMHKVAQGKWHHDYGKGNVYIGDDPAGRKMEIGVTPRAFGGKARNVVIKNLTIEKYASPLQLSAVDAEFGNAWIVQNNVIQLNHAVGVNAGPHSKIIGNRLLRNGQQGFAGGGSSFSIEGNEIGNNNYAGVNYKWEAGGGKVTDTRSGAVIRGNCVYGNDGPGIWADENVRDVTIENNVVFNNGDNGIMYEISFDGIIRNNIVADNGKKGFRWFWGPQILVSSSSNVHVYGNVVDVPAEYGNAITIVSQNRKPYPPASNNQVYNNTIVLRGTIARMGAVTDVRADTAVVATTNSIRQNIYHVADFTAAYWQWDLGNLDWNGIQRQGQEAGSTIDNLLPVKPRLDCAFLGLD